MFSEFSLKVFPPKNNDENKKRKLTQTKIVRKLIIGGEAVSIPPKRAHYLITDSKIKIILRFQFARLTIVVLFFYLRKLDKFK